MNIRVGTIGFPVNKQKLYPHVDIVELMETHLMVPRPSTGSRWREAAPAHVTFTVQLPRYLFEVPRPGSPLPGDLSRYGGFAKSDENLKLFDRTVKLADNLGARLLLLITPVAFTPAVANRRALRGFLEATSSDHTRIVWQPSGPWDHESAAAYAEELGAILAVDPLRDVPPKGQSAYFRLGPFAAMSSRVGVYDLERLGEAAAEFEDTTLVFGTPRALDDVRNFKAMLAESG
jgi:uncharacterized protein YecE (DUF72 family)